MKKVLFTLAALCTMSAAAMAQTVEPAELTTEQLIQFNQTEVENAILAKEQQERESKAIIDANNTHIDAYENDIKSHNIAIKEAKQTIKIRKEDLKIKEEGRKAQEQIYKMDDGKVTESEKVELLKMVEEERIIKGQISDQEKIIREHEASIKVCKARIKEHKANIKIEKDKISKAKTEVKNREKELKNSQKKLELEKKVEKSKAVPVE